MPLLTPIVVAGYSGYPRLSVSVSVCSRDKTKTAENTITKLATGIVHHELYSYTVLN